MAILHPPAILQETVWVTVTHKTDGLGKKVDILPKQFLWEAQLPYLALR